MCICHLTCRGPSVDHLHDSFKSFPSLMCQLCEGTINSLVGREDSLGCQQLTTGRTHAPGVEHCFQNSPVPGLYSPFIWLSQGAGRPGRT